MPPSLATATAVKPQRGLTGEPDEWVQDTFGKNPKTYKASDLNVDGSMKPAAPAAAAVPAPGGGGAAPAPAAATPPPASGLGKAKSAATKVKDFANKHVKVEVTQVGKEQPPRFALKTTINFDAGLDKSASKSFGNEEKGTLEVKAGIKASAKAIASFEHELDEADAAAYIASVEQNGAGGKFPEHQVLITGFTNGWDSAKALYAGMTGGAKPASDYHAGDKTRTEAEAEAGANVGLKAAKGTAGLEAEAHGTKKHRNVLEQEVQKDGKLKVTVTVRDEQDVGGKAGVKTELVNAHVGASSKGGKEEQIVLTLDPKAKEFPAQIKAITEAKTAHEVHQLAATYKGMLGSTTERDDQDDSTDVGAGRGSDEFAQTTKSRIKNEAVRNADGIVTDAVSESNSTSDTSLSHGKHKARHSDEQDLKMEYHDGKASGSLSHTTHDTQFGKSLLNAAKAVAKGGRKALDDGSYVAEESETHGLDFDDSDTLDICKKAVDASKWNGQVGGHLQARWVATGKAIRDALTVSGGKIVDADKVAVNRALAEWNKESGEGGAEVLDQLLRPTGAAPRGKAVAFPKGTEALKTLWHDAVLGDPMAPARKAADAHDGPQAAKLMQALRAKLVQLQAGLKKDAKLWESSPTEHSEMLGQVAAKLGEIAQLAHTLKTVPPADGKPASEDVSDLTDKYKAERESLQDHFETVFGELSKIEARMNEKAGFFEHDDKHVLEISPRLDKVEKLIKIWGNEYKQTYALFQKLKTSQSLDEAELTKFHPHGAQEKWTKLYDSIRDTSMRGRTNFDDPTGR